MVAVQPEDERAAAKPGDPSVDVRRWTHRRAEAVAARPGPALRRRGGHLSAPCLRSRSRAGRRREGGGGGEYEGDRARVEIIPVQAASRRRTAVEFAGKVRVRRGCRKSGGRPFPAPPRRPVLTPAAAPCGAPPAPPPPRGRGERGSAAPRARAGSGRRSARRRECRTAR